MGLCVQKRLRICVIRSDFVQPEAGSVQTGRMKGSVSCRVFSPSHWLVVLNSAGCSHFVKSKWIWSLTGSFLLLFRSHRGTSGLTEICVSPEKNKCLCQRCQKTSISSWDKCYFISANDKLRTKWFMILKTSSLHVVKQCWQNTALGTGTRSASKYAFVGTQVPCFECFY